MRNTNNIDLDFLKLQYQVLADKQISHSSLIWSAPSLLFVAMTFLWGIILNDEIHIAIRCLVSFVSICIAFASLQNFIRNRLVEIADSEQLVAIEKLMMSQKDVICPAMIVHHKFSERTTINLSGENIGALEKTLEQNSLYKNPISKFRTFYIWKFLLELILFITVIFFIYNFYLLTKFFCAG